LSKDSARSEIRKQASILAMNLRLLRGEILAVALLAVVGVLLFCGWLFLSGPAHRTEGGFGPEWDCSDQVGGAVVCIKHPPKEDAPK
jgi:hypothetical protein